MASINAFKLLNQKCLSYFNILENELARKIPVTKPSDKERLGFYLYMLESICNLKDTTEIVELITDTEFNKVVFNEKINDHGVDAVYIDDESNVISLFNFKFRESFNANKKQSTNDAYITTKFTNAILNGRADHLEGKLKKYAERILSHLNSREIWNMKLFVVSNDTVELDPTDSNIQQLEQTYDLEVVPIALSEITNFMSIRPSAIDSILVVDNEALMSYSEDAVSTAKSFIIRITLPELIRVTCLEKNLRMQYSIEDYSVLSKQKLDFSILFDNVRGFLGDTKYNKNITETLKKYPTRFFMYNNGITITAEDITSTGINGNKKVKLEIKNFQVVNGGQTLRTIHNFNGHNEENLQNHLQNAEILVRIFKTGGSTDNLINKIAEYTNSQNAISSIDLKSLAIEQIQIEQFLDESNIIYARKAGDTGISPKKIYEHKISMEKFAQILFSMQGFPEKASNQKKKIFEKYYESTFLNKDFDLSDSAKIVKRYYEIKAFYEGQPQYKTTDQKIFFVLYIDNYTTMPLSEQIMVLERTITKFKPTEQVSEARKLIQVKFKELLDKELGLS